MCNLISMLKSRTDIYYLKGATDEDIRRAEIDLGLEFAQDYHDLLSEYGVISWDGHEFTGICSSNRLNVVDVTRNERHKNLKVSMDMYVVEIVNIDSIVIWQSLSGEIFKTVMDSEPVKLCSSLVEYINL